MGKGSWKDEKKSDNIQAWGIGKRKVGEKENEGWREVYERVFGGIENTKVEGGIGEEKGGRGRGEWRGAGWGELMIG